MKSTTSRRRGRYHLLDMIRGVTLISMIAYHTAWDLVYIFGISWPWYGSQGAFYWQQSICWTFILLSGMCIPFSAHKWKRGMTVFAAGLLVTAVTLVFMPQARVMYGVLTLIGSAMLLMALFERPLFARIHAVPGLLVSWYLFYLFYHVNAGYLTLLPGKVFTLPAALYHGQMMTFLGFMEPGFFSADYFSLLPWIFLYIAGYYLSRLLRLDGTLGSGIMQWNIRPLTAIGRNSLVIYLLHQPAIYMVLSLLQQKDFAIFLRKG